MQVCLHMLVIGLTTGISVVVVVVMAAAFVPCSFVYLFHVLLNLSTNAYYSDLSSY